MWPEDSSWTFPSLSSVLLASETISHDFCCLFQQFPSSCCSRAAQTETRLRSLCFYNLKTVEASKWGWLQTLCPLRLLIWTFCPLTVQSNLCKICFASSCWQSEQQLSPEQWLFSHPIKPGGKLWDLCCCFCRPVSIGCQINGYIFVFFVDFWSLEIKMCCYNPRCFCPVLISSS